MTVEMLGDDNNRLVTVISLRECKQDVKKILPILIAKHFYEQHQNGVASPPSTILSHADCFHGAVNVEKICSDLSIALSYSTQDLLDPDGGRILGSANFSTRSIEVYRNDDPNRERFTIAHEIGHFCLKHDRYLRSEAVVESDLIANNEGEDGFNYDRLEYQATQRLTNADLTIMELRRLLSSRKLRHD
ncbi:ImmA/IrrE family metallo-endopeptidase [Ruegeria sp. 2012CJ41-6]|uniref:ImmA/IrrE family metallo-endopeptidase n=1 Tax=Ruegeria spongiae TaxID=2942209 RepID=A0ABT0Q7X9_9RHOB|nr:ImmA/IrrE family metallo-endopeptidase [Ruegeria spongiae]MCL6285986.1 ImmA/IrrE family metallo-endopeptidase [Ruegeria spongiae]